MADKIQIEEILKNKLAQLEISNPFISEEDIKKQKAELRTYTKPIKALLNDRENGVTERLQLMKDLIIKYVIYKSQLA